MDGLLRTTDQEASEMLRYVANKFFYMLVSLFILISATFFL